MLPELPRLWPAGTLWDVLSPVLVLLGASVLAVLFGSLTGKGKRLKEAVTILAFAFSFYCIYELYCSVRAYGPLRASLQVFGPPFGIYFYVDMLSVYMAAIFCGLGFLASIFSFRYMEVDTGLDKYYGLLLTLVAGMIGVAFAGDLFDLYVFWELMCVSAYALVAFRKYRWEAVEAGFKYLVMSTIGSLVALYGIALIYGYAGTLSMSELPAIMSKVGMTFSRTNPRALVAVYLPVLMIICGFGVTAALVPFHTWLPDAHPAAPAPMSAMLSGVVIKTGIYAMARVLFSAFVIPAYPVRLPFLDYGAILLVLGVLTITVANFVILPQRDLKRFLAYSSIVNMGYIACGVGIAAHFLHQYGFSLLHLAVLAAAGGLLHILNHAVGKGLLFLASGNITHETKTRDLLKIEGVGRKMPITGFSVSVALFHLAGVPPLAGFWSKLLIIWAGLSYPSDTFVLACTIVVILNSIYAAAYYLWLAQRLVINEPGPATLEAREAPASMAGPVLFLAIICILLTVFIGPVVGALQKVALALLGGG